MRNELLLIILLLPAIGAVNAIWLGGELRRFLQEVPMLRSSADLERFERVVARQMYGALAQIIFIGGPFLLFWFGVYRGDLVVRDIALFVLLPAAIIVVIGLAYRQVERRGKMIPAASPELEQQRDAIVRTWMQKPLPDW